jgi:outer membrane protein OmpA-like peptidoglycan-associated protein
MTRSILRTAPLALAALPLLAACAVPPRPETQGVQRIVFAGETHRAGAAVAHEARAAGVAETIPLGEVHFETAEAALTPEGIVRVAEIAAMLGADPGLVVVVEGFADPRGPAGLNRRLSEARAETVALRLVSDGVETGRIVHAGYGEAEAAGTGLEALAAARRVEVTLVPAG